MAWRICVNRKSVEKKENGLVEKKIGTGERCEQNKMVRGVMGVCMCVRFVSEPIVRFRLKQYE